MSAEVEHYMEACSRLEEELRQSQQREATLSMNLKAAELREVGLRDERNQSQQREAALREDQDRVFDMYEYASREWGRCAQEASVLRDAALALDHRPNPDAGCKLCRALAAQPAEESEDG